MKKLNTSGFTLIELMIVIAIISILMAYAIPAYQNYVKRTLLNEGNSMASSYKTSIILAFNNSTPLANITNGVGSVRSVNARGQCVSTATVTQGEIVIAYDCAAGTKGQANDDVDNNTLTWTPSEPLITGTATMLVWTCSFSNASAPFNPCPNA